jgi:hypothetical protein
MDHVTWLPAIDDAPRDRERNRSWATSQDLLADFRGTSSTALFSSVQLPRYFSACISSKRLLRFWVFFSLVDYIAYTPYRHFSTDIVTRITLRSASPGHKKRVCSAYKMGVLAPEECEIKLVGAKNFKRHNPFSDRFKVCELCPAPVGSNDVDTEAEDS